MVQIEIQGANINNGEKSAKYEVNCGKSIIFALRQSDSDMERNQVIDNIKQVAKQVLPKGSTLYLYGSRARGDAHEGSDWDLLVLLDKPCLEHEDFDKYSFPFVEMGWNIGALARTSVHMPTPSRSGSTAPTPCSIIM